MGSHNIYNYVERLSELLRVDTRQAGAEYGIQPVQLEVLHYLSKCNRFSDTPMGVTEYLGQTKGTVSQTLKVLEGKALISKRADITDKRISHLKVTAKGKKLLDQTIPTAMFVNAAASMTKTKQSEIEKSLNHLLTAMLRENQMKTFGICSTCRYNSAADNDGYFCNLVKQPLSADEITLICKEHE